MNTFSILLIGIGLSMDAFAVSICKGLSFGKIDIKKSIIVSLYFGLFQGIMPLIGYLLSNSFENYIKMYDHWIAFVLLLLIGSNMIKESFKNSQDIINDKVSFKEMILLSIATSIDALIVGITFAFLDVNILYSISIISVITFLLSLLACVLSSYLSKLLGNKSSLIGGIILIIIGTKILLEHLKLI